MPDLIDRCGLGADRLAELAEAVRAHTTLERVVRWGMMQGHLVADVVAQDEYTQDVVLPIDDALYLIYDAT